MDESEQPNKYFRQNKSTQCDFTPTYLESLIIDSKQQRAIIGEHETMFGRWSSVTGWHGVSDAYRARSLVWKGMWSAILLFTMAIGINQCAYMVYDFYTNDIWTTSISTRPAASLPVPTLYVCSLNMYNQSAFAENGLTVDRIIENAANIVSTIQQAEPIDLNNKLDRNGSTFRAAVHLDQLAIKAVSPMDESNPSGSKFDDMYASMESSTMQCRSLIIGCGAGAELTWGTTHENETILTEKCCEGSSMDEDYCFTLNLTSPFATMLNTEGRIEVANSENTIFLLMDPRLNDYMKKLMPGERPGQGFRLYFGISYDSKYYSKPMLISPGSYSLIELTYERTRTLSTRERGITAFVKPTPPCSREANYSYVNQSTYQKWACEADCQITLEMDSCGCTTVEGNYRPSDIYCHNVTARNLCKRVVLAEKNRPDNPYHRCKIDCKESCDWESINSIITSTTFPAPSKTAAVRDMLYKNGGRNFSLKNVANMALVEIYYGSLEIKFTERTERTTVNELISNIGGTLGVWAGISLITVYQAFLYLFLGFSRTMVNKRNVERLRKVSTIGLMRGKSVKSVKP